jgi:tRNA-splicing ligase RtcB (3'-phosphate/5'-hydroxy nucleic acid ligase)
MSGGEEARALLCADRHGETIEILHTLKPIGVAMAGENTFGPYKD